MAERLSLADEKYAGFASILNQDEVSVEMDIKRKSIFSDRTVVMKDFGDGKLALIGVEFSQEEAISNLSQSEVIILASGEVWASDEMLNFFDAISLGGK